MTREFVRAIVMGVNPKNQEDADYFEKEWRTNRAESLYR